MPKRRKSYGRKSSVKRRVGYGRRRTSYKRSSWKGRGRYSRYRITSRKIYNNLFPDEMHVKFKTYFTWSGTLVAGTSGISQPVMGNGLADPTGAFGTFQPTGFDQYCQFYNRYYVRAASLKLTGLVPDTGTFVTNYSIIPNANAAFTESSYNTRSIYEMPYATTKTVTYNRSTPVTVSNYMTTKKISGGHMSKINDACIGVFTTSTATNPTEQWYFNMRAWDPFLAGVANSYRSICVLTQYATLYKRNDIADSTADIEG